MKNTFPVVIIGAGPTGLGAALRLHQSGCDDWVIYERDSQSGGLSKSFIDESGFTWDIGGHVVFSHYKLFDSLMDELISPYDWVKHERESWIRIVKRWVPYPFQNNIHRLPRDIRARCIEELVAAAMTRSQTDYKNFDEFIGHSFGQGIADAFLRPYNRKVWASDLSKLDYGWIKDRIAIPDPLKAIRHTILKNDDISWGPNNRFRFPKRGGTGAIWKALSDKLPENLAYYDHEVVSIETRNKIVTFKNGHKQKYGTLISTIPLDCLLNMMDIVNLKDLSKNLRHSSVHVVGIGLEGAPKPENKTKCWMYFPEDNVPFYRVTHFSYYSPYNVDDIKMHWSLMAEVSESSDQPLDKSNLVNKVIDGLITSELIQSRDQVVNKWYKIVEYGYPTPTIGRDSTLNKLLPALYNLNILSRGRFGAWQYEVGNMDHSYMQGLEAASHILFATPEITLWYPDIVNQPHSILGWNQFDSLE